MSDYLCSQSNSVGLAESVPDTTAQGSERNAVNRGRADHVANSFHMPISHLGFASLIRGSPETIFDLIADMPNYGHWLACSQAFGETTEVSPYPVALGTTYLDGGPAGQRPGRVTGYDRPQYLAFHQTMVVSRGPLAANVDIHKWYTLYAIHEATRLHCDLDLTIQANRVGKLARPLLLYAFRKENARVLAALKRYVEARAQV